MTERVRRPVRGLARRTDRPLPRDVKQKIALFCDVDEEAVITARDVDTIYEVPLALASEGIDTIILKLLKLDQTERHIEVEFC